MGLLATAIRLMWTVDSGVWPQGIGVYLAANWAAPFGIALLADRLAAMMLLLTAVLAVAALLYSARGWSRVGVHFHSLFQFLLMGLNGAFLTHDLFNLFVFFEVMLAASYGLLLHGYDIVRLRAGMQYVAIDPVFTAPCWSTTTHCTRDTRPLTSSFAESACRASRALRAPTM